MRAVCAAAGAALLIMHSIGEPKIPHTHVGYEDIMARLDEFFTAKLALAEAAGVPREAIVIDPGIDFAKQRPDNLRIYRELDRFAKFDRPILLPVSRKTVIGEVLGLEKPAERDAGTVACIVQGMLRGAAIFRVHNVRAAAQTVRMIEAVEGAATAPDRPEEHIRLDFPLPSPVDGSTCKTLIAAASTDSSICGKPDDFAIWDRKSCRPC